MKHCCGDSRLRRSLKARFWEQRSPLPDGHRSCRYTMQKAYELYGHQCWVGWFSRTNGIIASTSVMWPPLEQRTRINYSSVRQNCIHCWCRWYDQWFSQKGAQFVTDDGFFWCHLKFNWLQITSIKVLLNTQFQMFQSSKKNLWRHVFTSTRDRVDTGT